MKEVTENCNTETDQQLEKILKEWTPPVIQVLPIHSGTLQDVPLPPPEGS
jgi:hypothetical protein